MIKQSTVPSEQNRLESRTFSEEYMITFLEDMTPDDLTRVITRIHDAEKHTNNKSHFEKVGGLISFIRGSTGPGLKTLNQILKKLYPDKYTLPEELSSLGDTPEQYKKYTIILEPDSLTDEEISQTIRFFRSIAGPEVVLIGKAKGSTILFVEGTEEGIDRLEKHLQSLPDDFSLSLDQPNGTKRQVHLVKNREVQDNNEISIDKPKQQRKPSNSMADLITANKLNLNWAPDKAADSLQSVFDYVMECKNEGVAWYIREKNTLRGWARFVRILSIVIGAVAALLPTIGELLPKDGTIKIGAGWTTILIGVVSMLLLLDRFFGFSTGWMRYMSAQQRLEQMGHEFQMDWEAEKASWAGNQPNQTQVLQMLARAKTFLTQVDNVISEETKAWISEFENAIRQIDESIKAKPAITEPGALNLTITNGDTFTDGWKLSIDSGEAETYRGKTAGKRNLIPGKHAIRVTGTLNNTEMNAEKVISVKAGETCEETLTLN